MTDFERRRRELMADNTVSDQIRYEIDNLDFIIPANYILVEVVFSYEKLGTSGLVLNTTDRFEAFDVKEHRGTSGKVIKLPTDLLYHCLQYDTNIPLLVDDIVWFDYRGSSHDRHVLVYGDRILLLINYKWCYVAKRGNNVICLSGWNLLEPVEIVPEVAEMTVYDFSIGGYRQMTKEEIETDMSNSQKDNTSFGILGDRTKKPIQYEPCKGIIRYLSERIESYNDDPELNNSQLYYHDTKYGLKDGDKVLFMPTFNMFLEHPLHLFFNSPKNYYRIQRKNFVGVYTGDKETDIVLFGEVCMIKLDKIENTSDIILLDRSKPKPTSGVVVIVDEYGFLQIGDKVCFPLELGILHKFTQDKEDYMICFTHNIVIYCEC